MDFAEHRRVMVQILLKLFADNELSAQLVFKGGTCLMLFYGLDRFSTDLDFDIREGVEVFRQDRMKAAIERYLAIKYEYIVQKPHGYDSYYWNGSYKEGSQKIKIEVSGRRFPQDLVIKDYLGVSVATMSPKKMLTHKLVALSERKKNRDLYDAWFMLDKNWDVDDQLIELRTGLRLNEYLEKVIYNLESNQKKLQGFILNDLGGMLSEQRRTWVKERLLDSLRTQLLLRLEELG